MSGANFVNTVDMRYDPDAEGEDDSEEVQVQEVIPQDNAEGINFVAKNIFSSKATPFLFTSVEEGNNLDYSESSAADKKVVTFDDFRRKAAGNDFGSGLCRRAAKQRNRFAKKPVVVDDDLHDVHQSGRFFVHLDPDFGNPTQMAKLRKRLFERYDFGPNTADMTATQLLDKIREDYDTSGRRAQLSEYLRRKYKKKETRHFVKPNIASNIKHK